MTPREYPPAALIRRALAVLHDPDDVIELRALHPPRGTQSGYYSDRDALVRDALRVEGEAVGVYVTLGKHRRRVLRALARPAARMPARQRPMPTSSAAAGSQSTATQCVRLVCRRRTMSTSRRSRGPKQCERG